MATAEQGSNRRQIIFATVTPLASIFGSGFLIIVPVLERTLGALSILGVIGVSVIAWFAGTAVRHCVRVVEPMLDSGDVDPTTRRLDRFGDLVIVIAYVISVALYLRIMAQYLVEYTAGAGSPAAERIIACGTVAFIIGVGIFRGFHGLDLLERIGLAAVLVLTTVLGGVLFFDDAAGVAGRGTEPATRARHRDRQGAARSRRRRHHRSGVRDDPLRPLLRPRGPGLGLAGRAAAGGLASTSASSRSPLH